MSDNIIDVLKDYGELISVEVAETFDMMRAFELGNRYVTFPNDCEVTCTYQGKGADCAVLEWKAFNVDLAELKHVGDNWGSYEIQSRHNGLHWTVDADGKEFQLASLRYVTPQSIEIDAGCSWGYDELWTRFFTCPDCKEDTIIDDFKFCPGCGVALEWDHKSIAEIEDRWE